MKKKKQTKRIIIFVILFFIVIVGVLLVAIFYSWTKTYHSKLLKLTITYPARFELEERFGEITLKSTKGNISIDRTGTNNDSLEKFLLEADMRNSSTGKQKERLHITFNKRDFVIQTDLNRKVYYTYDQYALYIFSTSVKDLYPDLDAIVQSVRFEP